jgi:hypothetical protein
MSLIMTILENRKNAFEHKFILDKEKSFKLRVMASKAFAQWAADEMKLDEASAKELSREVVDFSVSSKDNNSIIDFIKTLLSEYKKEFSTHYLEKILQEKLESCRSRII